MTVLELPSINEPFFSIVLLMSIRVMTGARHSGFVVSLAGSIASGSGTEKVFIEFLLIVFALVSNNFNNNRSS
jgi:hypothetical protein